jgi:hypothetical protein
MNRRKYPGCTAMTQFPVCVLIITFVFLGCSKKTGDTEGNTILLPDLGISIQIPEGLETVPPEQIQKLQKDAVGYPPILPFADVPCYQFVNPSTRIAAVISRLNFVDPDTAQRDPVDIMEEYRKNLEIYYKTDTIAANEFILGDYRIMSMNFLYEPGEEFIYLTKVLYHRYPQYFFMIDLYINKEGVNPEDAKKFEDMFLSIQTVNQ